ncbi:hypothetical protein TNCV_2151281 [Trichonephila clavipes]|nr:hypothetical protein TNCV_2151281 [Trichonephila clavipes]
MDVSNICLRNCFDWVADTSNMAITGIPRLTNMQGHLNVWAIWYAMRVSSRSPRLSLNKIVFRIISTDNYYFWLNSLKTWKFQTIDQLAT